MGPAAHRADAAPRSTSTTASTAPAARGPSPDHRHIAEFCENGAKAVAEEATPRAGRRRDFFAAHSVADLREQHRLLARAAGPAHRADVPRRRAPTHYEPIAWDDAFDLIADELRALDSPDEAVFYTSGRTSNEAAFLYQLFVRAFGTNNLPDCSNMCHESSGSALTETIGIGKGTVTLDDFDAGRPDHRRRPEPGHQPPAHAHRAGEGQARGATIVAVNPLPEAGLMRFKNPQTPRGHRRPRHRSSPTCSCSPARRRPGAVPGARTSSLAARTRPGAARPRRSSREHTDGFEEFADARSRRSTGTTSLDGHRPRRATRSSELADLRPRRRAHRSSAGRWA